MSELARPLVGGEPVERTFTLIAADENGRPVKPAVARKERERVAHFAFYLEAKGFAAQQRHWGYDVTIAPVSTDYQGPTDSPLSAWAATASKTLREGVDSD